MQPPLLPVFLSSVIHCDKFFHPVVLYENYLICFFMNINENFNCEKKIFEQLRDVHVKLPYVSPTMCSSVSNLVPIQSLDSLLLP